MGVIIHLLSSKDIPAHKIIFAGPKESYFTTQKAKRVQGKKVFLMWGGSRRLETNWEFHAF